MTFWKTFNSGNDTIAKLAIEVWRLKTECIKRCAGTPPFARLGLCHQQHLAASALPTRFGANPKIGDLQPSCPSPPVETRHYLVLLIAQTLLIAAGAAGFMVHRDARTTPVLGRPYYLLLTNAASLIATLRYLRGERMVTWTPIR